MALPQDTQFIRQVLDPRDVVDCAVILDVPGFLQAGEGVASYTLTMAAEGVAAGVQFRTDAPYATILSGTEIKFWLSVDPAMWSAPVFGPPGLDVGIEVTVVTTSTPPRTKQRTIAVKLRQR